VDGCGVEAVVVPGGGRGQVRGRVGQTPGGGGRGRFGLIAGEDLLEDVDRGERVGGRGGDDGVLVAVHGGDQVQVVAFSAAGEGDVQLLAGLGPGGDGVAGVGGDALATVHGGGIPELDMLGDVVAREPQSPPGLGVHDVEGPVVVRDGDGPPVAVLDEVGGGGPKAPVVVAGDDRVPAGDECPVGERRLLPHRASGVLQPGEPVGAGADVQAGGQLPGRGQHDRVEAGGPVGRPGGVGVVGDRGQVPDVDPVLVDVEPDAGGVAGADGQAGGGLGLVTEPDQLGEGDRADGGLHVAQHTTGGDGGQLPVVADEADAGAPAEGEPGDGGEVAGGGHSGLVDDDEGVLVDRFRPVRQVVAVLEVPDELGEGVGVASGLLTEDRRGHRGGRQPEHRPLLAVVAGGPGPAAGPGGGERGHGGGLPGPGGGDRQLQPAAGGGHLMDQVGLRSVEGDAVGDRLQQRQIDVDIGHDPSAAQGRCLHQEGLVGEHGRRRVELGAGDLIDADSVPAPQQVGHVDRVALPEGNGPVFAEDGGHDLVDEGVDIRSGRRQGAGLTFGFGADVPNLPGGSVRLQHPLRDSDDLVHLLRVDRDHGGDRGASHGPDQLVHALLRSQNPSCLGSPLGSLLSLGAGGVLGVPCL